MENVDEAQIFKALGDSTRLKILEMLKSDTLCACKILARFNFTQPTLSYHMKALTDCGLVTGYKQGKWTQYTLDYKVLDRAIKILDGLKEEK